MTDAGELWPDGPVALPATIRLGDAEYQVDDRPTMPLLHAVGSARWSYLVPGALRGRDRVRVARRLYDPADGLDFPHLWRAATILAGRLAGIPVQEGHDPQARWWPAHRIAQYTIAHWLWFDGWCIRRGFSPAAEPLHRIVAAGWQFMVDTRPSEGAGNDAKQISVEALRERVWTPPGPHRAQVMRFTASQERAAALAALRDVLPG